jgi:L-lysine 2,3-aminomutase
MRFVRNHRSFRYQYVLGQSERDFVEVWQKELQDGFRNVESLLHYLGIPLHSEPVQTELIDINPEFSVRVPLTFANRMKKGDLRDPLLLQVLPLQEERFTFMGFAEDAVGDLNAVKQKGLIQKYQGRVLLIMTGACAVHCRYCFRRHFPYSDQTMSFSTQQQLLSTLANDPSIEEVIFSGGDPLLLTNTSLFEWSHQLSKIPSALSHSLTLSFTFKN